MANVATASRSQLKALGATGTPPPVVSSFSLQDYMKSTGQPMPVPTQQSVPGLSQQFNDLLKQRQGIQDEKMALQNKQLQNIKTQENNAGYANAFKSNQSFVELMRQLLEASRRANLNQARIFS